MFEPLLFEECRAQLYSTWEELTETVSRDLHTVVRVRSVERRERGTLPSVRYQYYVVFILLFCTDRGQVMHSFHSICWSLSIYLDILKELSTLES